MQNEFGALAARIRELREICGYSAEEVSKDLEIGVDKYLKYEKYGEDIPISVLYRLSTLFGVELSELLTGFTARLDTFCVVKRGEGSTIDRFPGYKFQELAGRFRHKIMEPLLVTVEPSDHEPALVTHSGQEFNMVLQGEVCVLWEDKRVILGEGDSIYFDPSHPHGQMATNGKSAVFLTVICEKKSAD